MQKIDPESEKFMEFTKTIVYDNDKLREIITYAIFRAQAVLSVNPMILRKKLKAKLIKGAHEHGAPIYTRAELEREFEAECLDLIGWTLVQRYNEWKANQANG